MDVDDSAVDLSVRALPPELSELRALTASGLTITPAQAPLHGATGKRVLRPRSEQRSYAESPDIVLLPAAPPHRKPSINTTPAPFTELSGKLSVNVSITPSAAPNLPGPESPPRDPMDQDEDSDDNDVGPDVNGGSPHKELSSADIWERERKLRTLREKLRAEETKLVLLKKIRQSQQQPVLPAPKQDSVSATALAGSGCVVPPGVTVTPAPPPAHQHAKRSTTNSVAHMIPSSSVSSGRTSSLPGGATLTPGPYRTQSSSGGASITPSVTITPAPPPTAHLSSNNSATKASSRSSEDSGTPAQRQAAAKLALRKQLEKTLLQIPPPKPPPPEMNFIPSPSNTDFVYLVGLEHVVDYLTSEERLPRGSVPAVCAQCSCDFTAVWRWERAAGSGTARRGDATFAHGGARVLCELCVSGNVKRALKAEHTARLKTAFVRALQQEQEIERRLSAPAPSPPPAHSSRPQAPQAAAPRSSSRGSSASSASAPAPVTSKSNNTSSSRGMGSESLRNHHSERSSERSEVPPKKGKTSSSSNSSQKSSSNQHQMAAAAAAQMAFEQHSAAAMQALQHQLIRGLSGASGVGGVQSGGSMSSAAAAAAMMQFSPLLYTYQLAMAQAQVIAAGSGKNSGNSSSSGNAAIAAEMQRAVEVQRQYLLDMIPGQHGRSPWSNKYIHGGRVGVHGGFRIGMMTGTCVYLFIQMLTIGKANTFTPTKAKVLILTPLETSKPKV